MKKTIFIIAIAASMIVTSCKDNTEKTETQTAEATQTPEEPAKEEPASIVGVWKMSDMEIDMEIPKGQEAAMADMKKKMVDATVYTFNEDGTMNYKNHLVKETTGTYTLQDGKLVITSNTTKQSETVSVEELSADKLVITSEQGGRKATMSFTR